VDVARLNEAAHMTHRPADLFDPGLVLVRRPEWPGVNANRRVNPMSIKLTDTQLVVMSAAAQREDRCMIAPKSLKGGAAQKVATKLLTAGLAREIKAKAGMPVWRRDDEAELAYSLKLTAAGLKVIAVDDDAALVKTDEPSSVAVGGHADKSATNTAAAQMATAPREGTKIALVIGLLQRNRGATLDEVITATGWLPHTSRAALTGLRKRGYDVRLERGDKARGSIYRVAFAHAIAS
jgi:hypothetical protein